MIDVVGLGPGAADRIPAHIRELLADTARPVVLRTRHHPAAEWVATRREVIVCDDLYEVGRSFEDVYTAIADRVIGLGDAVYAVPGSPMVGELAVAAIRSRATGVTVHPAESFLDVILAHFGVDPLADGFQLLNGHRLPDVLTFDLPTVIGHLDRPEVLADALARLDRSLPEDADVSVVVGLGGSDGAVHAGPAASLDAGLAGLRTSLFVPPTVGGVVGVIHTMRRLRSECPWDRTQSHESLVRYLHEETAELIDAIADLGSDRDPGAYADVEEELGDVLLQVLFHAVIAGEESAFDITDVAETLRRKLVRRHPHVFGDVIADDAATVRANWDDIKAVERGGAEPASAVDGVPTALSPLSRAGELQRKAAKVGFDWPEVEHVFADSMEELEELRDAVASGDGIDHELGDVLFSVVNLARHLDVDPELALTRAGHRFEARFRVMESEGPMNDLDLDEMNARWERAKRRIGAE